MRCIVQNKMLIFLCIIDDVRLRLHVRYAREDGEMSSAVFSASFTDLKSYRGVERNTQNAAEATETRPSELSVRLHQLEERGRVWSRGHHQTPTLIPLCVSVCHSMCFPSGSTQSLSTDFIPTYFPHPSFFYSFLYGVFLSLVSLFQLLVSFFLPSYLPLLSSV